MIKDEKYTLDEGISSYWNGGEKWSDGVTRYTGIYDTKHGIVICTRDWNHDNETITNVKIRFVYKGVRHKRIIYGNEAQGDPSDMVKDFVIEVVSREK